MEAVTSGSLDECQRWCKSHGGTRLTHYSSSHVCRCCAASDELIQGTGTTYKLEGKCCSCKTMHKIISVDVELQLFKDFDMTYFVGSTGGSCETGYLIMRKQECKNVCTMLDIPTGTLKNNHVCYLAGNGKCRQDGRYKVGPNTKTSPICKN